MAVEVREDARGLGEPDVAFHPSRLGRFDARDTNVCRDRANRLAFVRDCPTGEPRRKGKGLIMLRILAFGILVGTVATALGAPSAARPVDPGVRGGSSNAGGALTGLTSDEAQFFQDGLTRFQDVEVVTGGDNNGLGPRFNSNQCSSCHLQPAVAGTSPTLTESKDCENLPCESSS